MSIEFINKSVLMPLLEEVSNVFASEKFLAGMDTPKKICILRDEEEFVCECKGIDFYLGCISVVQTNTAYTEMDTRLISYADNLTTVLDNYSSQEFKDIIRNYIAKVVNITDNNNQTKWFSEQICQKGISMGIISKNDINWYKRTTEVTIARQAAAVIQMRANTLSKRFIPLELILEAYKNGLYPFGWSFMSNTVYCLNCCPCPESLRSDFKPETNVEN